MKTINSFTGNFPIEVAANNHPTCGQLVTIIQSSGGMRFQHSMTREQAFEMATALVEAADSFAKELIEDAA